MAFLKLNNIVVPVLRGGATQDYKVIGESDRTDDLTLVTNRRGKKREWPFQVKHSDGATMLAFRDLIMGEGHVWSFERDYPAALYSSKGSPLVASGAVTRNTSIKKYGAASLKVVDSGYVQAATLLTGLASWSVHAWVYGFRDSATWAHFIVRSDAKKWVNGVRDDAAASNWLVTTSTSFKLIADSGADPDLYFDDVAVLPYLVPTDWPAQLAASTTAFGDATTVLASGDFIEAGLRAISVKGESDGAEPMRSGAGVRWVMRAKLFEV